MDEELLQIWVYLSERPLVGLTTTLLAYCVGQWLYTKTNMMPLFNPVLIAVAVLAGFLYITDTPYSVYFEGAQFVHFLLGPATVAMAVPLYRNLQQLKQTALPLSVALILGSITAVGSAVALAWLLGASHETLVSLAPKSVTTPIAMGITESLGGLPSLTAVLVILTGIIGGVIATYILNLLRIRDWRARGFAVGLAAHGIGTARAIQLNEVAGAFASLAIGLNGVATAILLPLIASFFL